MQLTCLVSLLIASFFAKSHAVFIPSDLAIRALGEAVISNTTTNITGLIYTGGEFLANITNKTTNTIVYEPSLNTTNVTLAELSVLSTNLNETESSSKLAELVISSECESLEQTGFYFALAYPNETVVVSENVTKGLYVANSTESFGRGGLVVNAKGVIYSAITYPHSAIGFITEEGKVVYFFEPSLPKILAPTSPLYTSSNFTAFNTSTVASNVTAVSIYNYTTTENSTYSYVEGRLDSKQQYPSSNDVTVVAVNGTKSANEYSAAHNSSSSNSYTVFASYNLTFIDTAELTDEYAIGAGFLSPTKASILVSFAKAAGVEMLKPFFAALV